MMESTIMYYCGSPGMTRRMNLQLRKMQWVTTYLFSDEKKGWIASRVKRTFDNVEVLVPPAFIEMKVPSPFPFCLSTLPYPRTTMSTHECRGCASEVQYPARQRPPTRGICVLGKQWIARGPNHHPKPLKWPWLWCRQCATTS